MVIMSFRILFYARSRFALSAELRSISDSTVFKNKLKTYLFHMAINVQ